MESLEKHIRSLVEVLEEEYNLYCEVFTLIKEEQSVLVEVNIDALERNLRKQHTLSARINDLEKSRLDELEVIGIYLGMEHGKLKLATIAGYTDDPDLKELLLKLSESFKSVLCEIMRLNRANRFLIDRSLQFIEKNVQVFFGALEEKGLYQPVSSKTGKLTRKNRMVDWRA